MKMETDFVFGALIVLDHHESALLRCYVVTGFYVGRVSDLSGACLFLERE